MSRGWLCTSIAFGLCFGLLFAAYPSWDLALAEWFFDPAKERFPLAAGGWSFAVREFANWIPWVLVLPALLALVCKLAVPSTRVLLAPSGVLYLLASFVIGPGLVSNALLKEGWGRPRPNQVE